MANVPISNLTTTWNNVATTFTGIKLNVTDTASAAASLLMDLQVGGASRFRVAKTGEITQASGQFLDGAFIKGGSYTNNNSVYGVRQAAGEVFFCTLGVEGYGLSAGKAYNWFSGNANLSAANYDLSLFRDAANTLAQRNGVNAQTFRLYNTFTDASNYERGFMRWSSNVLEIGAEAAGTGTQRNIFIGAGTKGISVSPNNNSISFSPSGGEGPVFNTSGIGFTGWNSGANYTIFGTTQVGNTNRAGSNVYVYSLGGSGNGVAGQVGLYASLSAASGTTGHTFELAVRTFLPTTGTPGLQFGGATSSFPALKRDTVRLQARLADDSAFTNIQGKLTTEANAVSETVVATHTLTIYDATGTGYKVLAVAA